MPFNKSDLRKRLLMRRRSRSPEERRRIDGDVFRQITSLEAYRQARTVFLYCSTDEEIDTRQLMEDAFCTGKQVCVPLCTDRHGEMEARKIRSAIDLIPGRYGIAEPLPDTPMVPPEEIDLCIVPCLSADLNGYRLGYGGGYYDRFLSQTPAKSAALCAECCLVPSLPAEPHDRPCNIIVTERRIHIAT